MLHTVSQMHAHSPDYTHAQASTCGKRGRRVQALLSEQELRGPSTVPRCQCDLTIVLIYGN